MHKCHSLSLLLSLKHADLQNCVTCSVYPPTTLPKLASVKSVTCDSSGRVLTIEAPAGEGGGFNTMEPKSVNLQTHSVHDNHVSIPPTPSSSHQPANTQCARQSCFNTPNPIPRKNASWSFIIIVFTLCKIGIALIMHWWCTKCLTVSTVRRIIMIITIDNLWCPILQEQGTYKGL